MSATQRLHEVANDALVRISDNLWDGAKLALVIYTPGEPGKDIVLKDQGLDHDEVLSTLRRSGLSIDGENAYKRDLIDVIIGALASGKQGVSPPPAGHWGQQFWDIGRAEGEEKEQLLAQDGAEPASPWIKCSDRLPDREQRTVAVLFDDGEPGVAWAGYWSGARTDFAGWQFPVDDLGADRIVTHWMPLPDAPAKGGDGEVQP